jgi:prevent-host-death family protein
MHLIFPWSCYNDHGQERVTFKARCLAVMKKVQATGEPVIVTKRGTPVVKIVPAQSEKNDIFGFMAGRVKIVGDIESPIPVEWENTTK